MKRDSGRTGRRGIFFALTVLAVVAAACIFTGELETRNDFAAQVFSPEKDPVFVIDPGHGGIDGGAVGVGGIVEKELNLEISLKLRDMLEFWGYRTVMTRETDISIHSPEAKGAKQMKTSDLHNRLAIVSRTPGAIYLGIHQNMFGQSRYDGAQIFYGVKSPESGKLAGILQDCIVSRLQPENIRQPKRAQDNLFLLCQIDAPAVLIECGFISNPEEAALLCDGEYQNKLAAVIFAAVNEYLAGGEEAP